MALKMTAVQKLDMGKAVAEMGKTPDVAALEAQDEKDKSKKEDLTGLPNDPAEPTLEEIENSGKNKLQTPVPYADIMRQHNPTVGLQKPVPMAGGTEFSSTAT